MAEQNGTPHFDIPKTCKAGVCVNEGSTSYLPTSRLFANLPPIGPDFRVEIQDVPVPEPGENPVPN